MYITETPFGNLDHTFAFFKEMVLRHAVNVSKKIKLSLLSNFQYLLKNTSFT